MPADPHKIFSRDKDNLKFLWNQSLIKLKSWFPHYALYDSRICSDVCYKNSKENCDDYILYTSYIQISHIESDMKKSVALRRNLERLLWVKRKENIEV